MRVMLNPTRLRVYPRLFLVASWSIVILNFLLRQGWRGGLRQIIGIDLITFYAAGTLYRTNTTSLYDFPSQLALMRQLVFPTAMPGSGLFLNPPFVAAIYALLTYLPLVWAFAVWSLLMIVATGVAAYLAYRLLTPRWLLDAGLTFPTLLVIALSSFAFIEGFQAGQNHGLTLLLVTGICVATLAGRWYTAGVLGGLLVYKPQFVLGFLLIWLIWRRWKALLAFAVVTIVWAGGVLLSKGIQPYRDFLDFSGQILFLPYTPGWPGYLLVTPFGLLSTVLPPSAFPVILWIVRSVGIAMAAFLALFAFRSRDGSVESQRLVVALAVLFPLIATPYALLHDLLLLIPVLLLMADEDSRGRTVLYLAVIAYAAALIAPVVGAGLHLALPALIPLGVLWVLAGRALAAARTEPTSNPGA
jgi:hypothetical protein